MARVVRRRQVEKNLEESQAITCMVVDEDFLRQIRPIAKLEYFIIPFAQTIAKWCIEYWDTFEEAPGMQIEDIFFAKEKKGEIDEDHADVIRNFLTTLSSEYEKEEERSTEYWLSVTEIYFRKRNMEILKDDITRHLEIGRIDDAETIFSDFITPCRETNNHINPFNNESAIREGFTKIVEPLFRIPGDLGKVVNDMFVKDALVAIMGPEKRGKTWWLMFLSIMAARAGVNVAFFAVGDMTEPQMTVRYHVMNAKRSNKAKYCSERLLPILDCYHNQTGACFLRSRLGDDDLFDTDSSDKVEKFMTFEQNPTWIPCTYCQRDKEFQKEYKGAVWYKKKEATDPLHWRSAYRLGQEFVKKKMGGDKHFRLSCHANTSINIKGVRGILAKWKKEGFEPGLVAIDYADILAPEDPKKEFRHQQNDTWKAMRKGSQELENLWLTATQADAGSYDEEILGARNFSEDKRKYSHVTGILTLNQKPEEKKAGVMRIGQMFLREDDFDINQTVTVLQSLATGQPVMGSFITPKKEKPQKTQKEKSKWEGK